MCILRPLRRPAGWLAILVLLIGAARATTLHAGHLNGVQHSSLVEGMATFSGDTGLWTYQYTVFNTTPIDRDQERPPGQHLIVDWELPWFGDAGIDLASILAPAGWAFEIAEVGVPNPDTWWTGIAPWQDPDDGFYFGATSAYTHVTHVLHWYTPPGLRDLPNAPIFEGESLDGFAFVSVFNPTDAPYAASWLELPNQSGDPLFPLGAFPDSSATRAVIPEPSTLMLFGIGWLVLILTNAVRGGWLTADAEN